MAIKAESSMKLPLLLTTMLLTTSPAVAGELLYLKCDTKVQYKAIDTAVDEGEMDLVLYYELDLKNKLLTDSKISEDPREVKIQNGMVIQELELRNDKDMSTEIRFTKFSFDPPGKFVGSSDVDTDDNSFTYDSKLVGSCKASNKSAYEANK